MRVEPITKRFLKCPRCQHEMGAVDHLAVGQKWGPWQCPNSDCHASVSGVALPDGALDVEVTDTPGYVFALLRLGDLYLVAGPYQEFKPDHWDYFFHSHQCTQNILRRVVAVYDPEHGSDPHGCARFIATIPCTSETRLTIDDAGNYEDTRTLAALFAMFKTDGAELATKWPAHEGGMLPFIAEAQRKNAKKGDA